MSAMTGTLARGGLRPNRRAPVISTPVFGVLLFVFVELMFFSALFSSYFVIRRGREIWDIPGTVHLPDLAAGFNTLVLVLSGFSLLFAGKTMAEAKGGLLRALGLGLLFFLFQIFLSARLAGSGLTMTSSLFGGCFFLLVGAHAIHVLAGVIAMAILYRREYGSIAASREALRALQVFWLSVVAVWPFLYAEIYF